MQGWASSRSPRNASGIHGCYPEVPQKRKPGAHLHPSLLRHAASTKTSLFCARPDHVIQWTGEPQKTLNASLAPNLPYKDMALSMGRHSCCPRYCSHRACSSGNRGSQTGSDHICLRHNLPYMDTGLATSLGEKTATLIQHEVPGFKAGAGECRWRDLFEQDKVQLTKPCALSQHSHTAMDHHLYANIHSFLWAHKTVC